jgi:hypothetical protein
VEEETSKLAFYLLGSLFAAWAVLLGAIGIMRHESFPPTAGAARGVMAISLLLMVGTVGSAILTG